jgi:uncharacterized protein (TIGR02145 family)
MKKIFYILAILAFGFSQAQPQKVNYQAVALTAGGQTVKNQAIKLRLSIVDSSATGTVLYTETHQPTTDGAGQFSVFLGGGIATVGTFSNIAWGNGKDKFLKAEADVTGGTNYVLMGSSQIVSVPYAIAAGSSLSSTLLTDSFGNLVTIKYDTNGNSYIALIPKPISGCGQVINYLSENYPTVQIGNQCWFAKNLNVGTLKNAYNSSQINNGIIEKYCYDNDPLNCDTFGGLYQWAEALQYQNGASNTSSPIPTFSGNIQGICPTGWHIPSLNDWKSLEKSLGGRAFAGSNLNADSILWNNFNLISSNNYGFNALPSGFMRPGSFMQKGVVSGFWIVSNFSSSEDLSFFTQGGATYSQIFQLPKNNSLSVRCLKD